MQDIEPYYQWRELYIASEDELSPFHGVVYSEFEFSNTVYNYFIHPQWDDFGSNTLYLKIIFVDYDVICSDYSKCPEYYSDYLHLTTQGNYRLCDEIAKSIDSDWN